MDQGVLLILDRLTQITEQWELIEKTHHLGGRGFGPDRSLLPQLGQSLNQIGELFDDQRSKEPAESNQGDDDGQEHRGERQQTRHLEPGVNPLEIGFENQGGDTGHCQRQEDSGEARDEGPKTPE